jgi:hypothetical protein
MRISQQKYLLLGDVVHSRAIANRKAFEKKLGTVLKKVSKGHQHHFQVPLSNWKGLDEVAAVIHPLGVFRIIADINKYIYPQTMRFVLVKGSIDIKQTKADITTMDGSVFHEAVYQMGILKKEMQIFKQITGNPVIDKALSNQINLLMLLKKGWTNNQHQLYTAYGQGQTQEEIAAAMHITQQTVSKTLKAVNASAVLDLEKSIQQWSEALQIV